ncbi:MAG: hypothetical protein M3Z75_19710 [Actinomycetota bacterium]|nr:hypothetical protein [Actinomycetota bacterium]
MNTNMAQSLIWDHIRESRQQAAAARRADGARHSARAARRHGAWRRGRQPASTD